MFAEFELSYAQLSRHIPISNDESNSCRARLNGIAYLYCGTPNDTSDFHVELDYLAAVRGLKTNLDLFICKLDKRSGVVVMNKCDYVEKMLGVLNDETKVKFRGNVAHHDCTAALERK